jgi:hypothetical protein
MYDKNQKNIECLKLSIHPYNNLIKTTMHTLYNFDKICEYELQVSTKSAIVCNSNQNAAKKTLSNFPNGYIRMDLYKNKKPIYSYYKDLHKKVSKQDINDGFKRLKKDLALAI